MNRRIRIILLAISLLLVIGTLGWLTHVLLVQAEETGHSEQRIRVEALAHEAKLEMDRLLTSFITFEQARGYFEYQPVYAYKRPYDLRMGAPAPGEATRDSNLAAYLPDYVTAFIQISPAGRVTGPADRLEGSAGGCASGIALDQGTSGRLSGQSKRRVPHRRFGRRRIDHADIGH